MHHARVIAAHRAPDRPAIQVAVGDPVTLGERDSDWPQFVWTTLAQGLGGWIPAVLFDREVGEATALADYDTRELPTEIGELITVHHEQEGWWWAENSRGQSGWIPARVIELIENESASL
ncbi:MAG TPA: SH3 domain-containing protein [Pseudoxanthomonas sp.]|nr:SH3 domain-containing protein [Pseudoxanthomonas sp.]